MQRFKIVDQDNFTPPQGLVLPTDDIVDRDGYRDTRTMVMEMIDAGERLADFRREEYEYLTETEDFELDVTRSVGFDPIDAQRIMQNSKLTLQRRLEIEEAIARGAIKVEGGKLVAVVKEEEKTSEPEVK